MAGGEGQKGRLLCRALSHVRGRLCKADVHVAPSCCLHFTCYACPAVAPRLAEAAYDDGCPPGPPYSRYRKKLRVMNDQILKRWAYQILEGLVYLHGHDPPIVHRGGLRVRQRAGRGQLLLHRRHSISCAPLTSSATSHATCHLMCPPHLICHFTCHTHVPPSPQLPHHMPHSCAPFTSAATSHA